MPGRGSARHIPVEPTFDTLRVHEVERFLGNGAGWAGLGPFHFAQECPALPGFEDILHLDFNTGSVAQLVTPIYFQVLVSATGSILDPVLGAEIFRAAGRTEFVSDSVACIVTSAPGHFLLLIRTAMLLHFTGNT